MARNIDGAGPHGIPGGETGGEAPRPAPRRFAERFRIPIAFVALVVWLLITAINPFNARHANNFVDTLAGTLQLGILLAGLFLIVLTALCRWGDLGLRPPEWTQSLRLLWLPGIYLLLFLAGDIAVSVEMGPPPLTVLGFLLLNAALAAFSEEMMFRGVLFGALRTRLRPWLAILVTTVLFGLAHLLNAVAIGNFSVAATQAVAAAMSGTLFIAIRVRTGSLLPAIVYHGLWDFCTLIIVARSVTANGGGVGSGGGNAPPVDVPLLLLLAPLVLLVPNFLYALFLLRPRRPPAVGEAKGAAA